MFKWLMDFYWKREIQKHSKFKVGNLIKFQYDSYRNHSIGQLAPTVYVKAKIVDIEVKGDSSIFSKMCDSYYIYYDFKTKAYASSQIYSADTDWELDSNATVNESFNKDLDKLTK